MTSHKLTSTSRLPYDDMCGCDREDEPRIAAAPYFDGGLEGAIAALERQFDLRRQGLPSSIDEPIARAEDVLGEVPISRRMDGTSRPRSAMDSLVASFATIAADWRR